MTGSPVLAAAITVGVCVLENWYPLLSGPALLYVLWGNAALAIAGTAAGAAVLPFDRLDRLGIAFGMGFLSFLAYLVIANIGCLVFPSIDF